MMENYDKEFWENKKCPKYDCKKDACKCGLKKVYIPAALGDDSKDSSVTPKNGAYCNAIVVYEANNHVYIYSKEGIPTLVETGGDVEETIKQLENQLAQEVLNRQAADGVLQGEIDDLKNSPDVVDIVATYAALQAYDTSKLGDNDIVRVLADETHDGQSTYYRWNATTSSWTYVGAVGDYYTKGQVDTLLADKQNTLTAGANITIDANNEISATDTTYTHFTGATASTDGVQGLVPGPLAGDEDKFLKADGTWDTVNAGPTVVQTTGTSTTDVMSQNAVTGMIYANTASITNGGIRIGPESSIGSTALRSITIGPYSSIETGASYSVALGANAKTTRAGEVNIGAGATTNGYNYTSYRVLGGVHDGQTDHDAVTVGQLNGRVKTNSGAPTTSTIGTVGQLLEDTTNGKLYQCTAIDITDPNNPAYTWTEVGGGGGGGIIELTSADYNWPENNPNGVAIWTLDSGVYISKSGVKLYRSNNDSIPTTNDSMVIVQHEGGYPIAIQYNWGGVQGNKTGGLVLGYTDNNGTLVDNNINNKIITDLSRPLVQTTGNAITDVMSQNATTSMIFRDPATRYQIQIGAGASASGNNGIAAGAGATVSGNQGIALGPSAKVTHVGSVALGQGSKTSVVGEVSLGGTANAFTYNSSGYRLLTNVYDGQSAHDAVTLGQMNTRLGSLTLLTISQTDYDNLQTYDANTLYIITGA